MRTAIVVAAVLVGSCAHTPPAPLAIGPALEFVGTKYEAEGGLYVCGTPEPGVFACVSFAGFMAEYEARHLPNIGTEL